MKIRTWFVKVVKTNDDQTEPSEMNCREQQEYSSPLLSAIIGFWKETEAKRNVGN